MNRREFIRSGTVVSVAAALGGHMAQGAESVKPFRVALIGCGWYGKSDLFRLMQVAPIDVVALCDVDRNMLNGAADAVAARQTSRKRPQTYGDYRELLKHEKLDIVLVCTPDHWHALPTIAAIEAGADVFVQKPICVDIAEGAAMLAAARKHGRVVQVGTQRRSTPHLVEARKQVVEAGLLGKIAYVEMCCYYHMGGGVDGPEVPVPDFLDYEMWTGPAPRLPYQGLPHRGWWRRHMEYGNGIIGDMCIHMYDTARWMLDLGWPARVYSSGGIRVRPASGPNISDTQTAVFEHDGLDLVWTHRAWGAPVDPKYPWSVTLYGDKGTLKAGVMGYDFIPQDKSQPPVHKDAVFEREQYPEDLQEKDIELFAAPAMRAHMKNFIDAIATRGRPVADIEQGYISSAACILANLSMKLNRALAWDPARNQVIGDDEANRLLARPYRAPWVHPRAHG